MELAKLSDKRLVELFLQETEEFSGPAIRDRVDGVTEYDVSRWRRGDFKRLTAEKRKSLVDFLERERVELRKWLAHEDAEDVKRFFDLLEGRGDVEVASLVGGRPEEIRRWREKLPEWLLGARPPSGPGEEDDLSMVSRRVRHFLATARGQLLQRGRDIPSVTPDPIDHADAGLGDVVEPTLPDVSYLKPRAREIYDRALGSYFTRRWPIPIIERAARELVAYIEGANTLRSRGAGKPELTEEEQVWVLEDGIEEVERAYGPNGVVRRL